MQGFLEIYQMNNRDSNVKLNDKIWNIR